MATNNTNRTPGDTVAAAKALIETIGAYLDDRGLSYVADSAWENVTDEIGPEPADDDTHEAAAWWARLAGSVAADAEAHGY